MDEYGQIGLTINILKRISKEIERLGEIHEYIVCSWGYKYNKEKKYAFTIQEISAPDVIQMIEDGIITQDIIALKEPEEMRYTYLCLYCIEISTHCLFKGKQIIKVVTDEISFIESYIDYFLETFIEEKDALNMEHYDSDYNQVIKSTLET